VSDAGDQSRSATTAARGQMRESIVPAETDLRPHRRFAADDALLRLLVRGGTVLKVGMTVPSMSLPPIRLPTNGR
jgi:hypothetical protein